MRTTPQDTVRCRFFAPVEEALEVAVNRRKCNEFPDEVFLDCGIGRVISVAVSGREWVQKIRMWMNSRLSVGSFFEALKSVRRLSLVEEIGEHVRQKVDRECPPELDPLAEHKELKEYAVYASDGHYEQSPAHGRKFNGDIITPGYFYSFNLESGRAK